MQASCRLWPGDSYGLSTFYGLQFSSFFVFPVFLGGRAAAVYTLKSTSARRMQRAMPEWFLERRAPTAAECEDMGI